MQCHYLHPNSIQFIYLRFFLRVHRHRFQWEGRGNKVGDEHRTTFTRTGYKPRESGNRPSNRDDCSPPHPNLDLRYWSSPSQFLSLEFQQVNITLLPHMTTHIANCGYSSLFTAGLFNVEPGQYSPSNAQASFLDQFRQTSPSPRVLLPSSKHSLDGSAHLHIQVPSSTEPPKQRRQFRIVSPTSPIKSSLFNVGTMWLLNRRRDVNRRNALQTLSVGREHNGAYNLSQAVSGIKR